jgi:iron(III) transport system substrate-binding protein
MSRTPRTPAPTARWPALAVLALAAAACGDPRPEPGSPAAETGDLVVYSGRAEKLVQPVLTAFEQAKGRRVRVRYGDTAELAATLLEEGARSPADVYFAQDAGGLGALAAARMLRRLPDDVLGLVPPGFRSSAGEWVGVSGRARVLAYSTARVRPEELPESVLGLTDPRWKGRVGWAPQNGSFQAFVTALRLRHGDDEALRWLRGIVANAPKSYAKNAPAVQAVADGEVDVALVNHYYLFRFLEERGPGFPVRNHYFPKGDVGNLVNVAGAGVLATSRRPEAATELVRWLLGDAAQRHFALETSEYPLRPGVPLAPGLTPLAEIDHPEVDLDRLADLERTLEMLRAARALD